MHRAQYSSRFRSSGATVGLDLVAEFISPPKVCTFSLLVGNIIRKSVKCIHSATKYNRLYGVV